MANELAIGVEVAVDRTHTSIALAGRTVDGRVAVRLSGYLEGTDHAPLIANMITSRPPRAILATILDPRSPSATLLEPLKALKVDVTEASTHIVAAAHGVFADELRAGRLVVEKHPALDAAAKHAMSRQLAGGEALERRKPPVDTSPIVAAELAVWAVLNVPPRRIPHIYGYKGVTR